MAMGLPIWLVVTLVLEMVIPTPAEPQVPCYFVFGDSLSDSGNNNNLDTLAKANYQPYGIDFPGSVATGRFTNNKTYVDVITELLGFERFIPPFNKNLSIAEANNGVNYASGGAGILYETGRLNLGNVISFYEQIRNHQSIVAKFGSQINVSQCLYTINIGSNDYINNYFNNGSYPTSQVFTPTQFASILVSNYRAYTKLLYGLGARKIAFYLLSQIGCTLGEIAAFNATACIASVNDAVATFNSKLVPVIAQLDQQLPGARFTYINSSAVATSAFIEAGVTVFNASCCTPRSDGQCAAGTTPCSNRNQHYFWDLFHPTDVVVKVVGGHAYKAQSSGEAVPYDIDTLLKD